MSARPAYNPAASAVPLPAGWERRFDPSTGNPYYVNHNDGTTSWTAPPPQSAVGPLLPPAAAHVPVAVGGWGQAPAQSGELAAAQLFGASLPPHTQADVASVKAKISGLSPAELTAFFAKLDVSRDGRLSLEELRAVGPLTASRLTPGECSALQSMGGTDGSGQLDLAELRLLVGQWRVQAARPAAAAEPTGGIYHGIAYTAADVKRAKAKLRGVADVSEFFGRMDIDGDGMLSLQEWLAAAPLSEVNLTPSECAAAFEMGDGDGNGVIDLHEFQQLLMAWQQLNALRAEVLGDAGRLQSVVAVGWAKVDKFKDTSASGSGRVFAGLGAGLLAGAAAGACTHQHSRPDRTLRVRRLLCLLSLPSLPPCLPILLCVCARAALTAETDRRDLPGPGGMLIGGLAGLAVGGASANGGDDVLVFQLVVTKGGVTTTIYRRWSELAKLSEQLAELAGQVAARIPKLPTKGNKLDADDPADKPRLQKRCAWPLRPSSFR
eukprot:SAG22_NODE_197_length_15520_cov_116.311264_10_plen_493_part_00